MGAPGAPAAAPAAAPVAQRLVYAGATVHPLRRSLRCLWLLVVLAPPLPAAAASWHQSALSAAPLAADLAGTQGVVVLSSGAQAEVHVLVFPPDAPPATGALLDAFTPASPEVVVATDGTTVLVAHGGSTLRRQDAGGVWGDVTPVLGGAPIASVDLDPGGSGYAVAVVADTSPFPPSFAISADAGASWQDYDVAGAKFSDVAVLGMQAVAVQTTPTVGVVSFEGTTPMAQLRGNPMVGLAEVVVTGGGTWVVLGGGLNAQYGWTTFTGALTMAPHPTAAALQTAATAGNAVWIAEPGGAIHQLPQPDAGWDSALTEATGLQSVVAVVSADPSRILALGLSATGPAMAWRNRPPVVDSPPADTMLTEGGAPSPVGVVAADPDGEVPGIVWSCDLRSGGGMPRFGDPTAPSTTVAVDDDPSTCPGDPDEAVVCRVSVSDVDGPAADLPFTLSIAAADTVAPTVPVLGLPATVALGDSVTATASSSDSCPAEYRWQLLDAGGGVVDQATTAFGTDWLFTPAAAGDYTVRVEAVDSGGNVSAAEAALTVVAGPPPEGAFTACPTMVVAGETARLAVAHVAGPVPDAWRWEVGGAATACSRLLDGGTTCEIDLDRCVPDGSTVDVRVVPESGALSGPPVSCTLTVIGTSTPPQIVVRHEGTDVSGAVVPVLLSEGDTSVAFDVEVSDCPAETVSLVPSAPPGMASTLDRTEIAGSGTARLELSIPFDPALEGSTQRVEVEAFDGRDRVTANWDLAIALDPAVRDAAAVRLVFDAPAPRVPPGSVLRVSGRIEVEAAAPLPRLVLDLEHPGLHLVRPPVVESPCARLTVGPEGRLEADGLFSECGARFELWVRRSLGTAALRPAACRWGPDERTVRRCEGALSLGGAAPLGCSTAAGRSGGAAFLLLCILSCLTCGAAGRRRRGRGPPG
ncbi:MAG: hypothetical protein D6729_01655 [Deltaproteobacteria bacterium]|nr:MAG: hypothetical protein D6729_01655 [Deltaproteobacteria bacterium]